MAMGRYPWEDEQDVSSFYQQQSPFEPFGGDAMSPAAAPSAIASPAAPPAQQDPFTPSYLSSGSSVSGHGPIAEGFFGDGFRSRTRPPGIELRPDQPKPAAAPGASGSPAPFDYGGLMSKIKTATDDRSRAIATDQLGRTAFSQLKNAGHDVSWDGDNLVVDGRPYLIGDGADAPPRDIVSDPNSTSAWVDRESALNNPSASGKTPNTSPYQTQSDLANAPGGRTQGGAASPEEAYDRLAGRLDPNASREEMEAAIEEEFGHLPGYGGAYKESVMLNGRWYDMVTGYGGAGASWGGLTPKGPSKSAMGAGMFSSRFANPMSPYGSGATGTGAGIGTRGARDVQLNLSQINPALLALMQNEQPEPDPLMPSYAGMLQ